MILWKFCPGAKIRIPVGGERVKALGGIFIMYYF